VSQIKRLPGDQERILVVDDVPANIGSLRAPLEAAGYEVLIATSGEDALEVVADVIPDLILLDIMMPGIDGFQTCRRLKKDEATAHVPVIFITALDETDDVVKGFKAGGEDYVVKPFRKEELLARVATQLDRARLTADLEASVEELKEANRKLRAETKERKVLATKLATANEREAERWGVDGFVGQSPLLQKILDNIQMLERAESTSVLITGESGTGKELVARAVHAKSRRAGGPFIAVNCASVPRDLAESLIFGHLKGAFTGADEPQTGYFDLADGGTLFLDEVGDMPYDLQIKLLRVLEDGQVMPLGARRPHAVDVRVVAATNADLVGRIRDGGFRQDLYYRIARFTVEVPPLRERREDIPLLAQHFLQLFADEMGMPAPEITKPALKILEGAPFPGNIRELKNTVERALIESQGKDIEAEHLRLLPGADDVAMAELELPLNYDEAVRTVIERAIDKSGGNVSAAARLLGIDRFKIYRKLKG
jgi:DNA-binding NtrC family response regulator